MSGVVHPPFAGAGAVMATNIQPTTAVHLPISGDVSGSHVSAGGPSPAAGLLGPGPSLTANYTILTPGTSATLTGAPQSVQPPTGAPRKTTVAPEGPNSEHALRLLMEEDFWKQKAAVRWVAESERNTRFFQGYVRPKRAKSYIHSIEADGSSLTQEAQIRESAISNLHTHTHAPHTAAAATNRSAGARAAAGIRPSPPPQRPESDRSGLGLHPASAHPRLLPSTPTTKTPARATASYAGDLPPTVLWWSSATFCLRSGGGMRLAAVVDGCYLRRRRDPVPLHNLVKRSFFCLAELSALRRCSAIDVLTACIW
ncbi:outer arm dynein light chain 1 protein [Striga asiatica]|uniref:Outer arm dynein light chain 1 protein n=1 Tax=Striga asiatica TaxID=4170 RepID=A0A5A7R8N1_STRAF|nr:outer arm dynein light chain 1 protein [Striga asiatica]